VKHLFLGIFLLLIIVAANLFSVRAQQASAPEQGANNGAPPANPLKVAILHWYQANRTASFKVGKQPHGVAFDGENIWSANNGDGTVSKIRASDGENLGTFHVGYQPSAGQFQRPVYYRGGQRPYQVIATQLTGSGNCDLVVADYLSNQIVVLLGNGDGTFQNPLKFSVPAPIGLAGGDLNHDGKQDLVVVESGGTGTGALAVFLGDGEGKFTRKASYQVGSQAGFVILADFDGDGNLDVAETDQGDGSEGVLRVFRGTGKGTLLKPTVYKIPGTPGALAAADLNGDQHPDVALVQYATGSVGVLINDGTGKFGKPVTYHAGGGEVVDVKIADLNHDGMNDLAVVNASKNEIAILLNKGEGTFKPARFYPTGSEQGSGTDALVIADFDLNGKLDIAAVNKFGEAALLYGNGNGTFQSAIPIHDGVGSNSAFSIAAGDFNNDGAPDLAVPIEITGKPRGKVAILLNTQ
jgi:FG-GAP-like repeat